MMAKLKTVNLIPKEALRKPILKQLKTLYSKNRSLRNFSIIAFILVFFTFIQILSVGRFNSEIAKSKQAMQDAKVKLNKLQSQYLQLEKIKATLLKEESQKKQGLELLLSTSSKDRKFSNLLSFLAELTPQDLWIDHLVLTETEAQIIGITPDNQLIAQFINRLDESKIFKNSRFTSSEKKVIDSHTLYNFQISTEPIWDQIAVIKGKEEPKAESQK